MRRQLSVILRSLKLTLLVTDLYSLEANLPCSPPAIYYLDKISNVNNHLPPQVAAVQLPIFTKK